MSKAAKMAGVSLSTIKRKRAAGAFPNAQQADTGVWLIPVEDLLGAGYHLNRSTPITRQGSDPDQSAVHQAGDLVQVGVFQTEGLELRHQAELADAVHRAELAEALLAAERRASEAERRVAAAQTQRAEALAEALALAQRALPAGATPAPAPAETGRQDPETFDLPASTARGPSDRRSRDTPPKKKKKKKKRWQSRG